MSKLNNLYSGRAGQMAAMSEFLIRGYNVAIPEVDVGDDIFVVKDSSGDYSRIQVKTAIATKISKGYSTRYSLKLSQLRLPSSPETWYVFVNRLELNWQSFVVIPREDLAYLQREHMIGSVNKNNVLSLYLSYTNDSVTCSNQNLSEYLNNWDQWPFINH